MHGKLLSMRAMFSVTRPVADALRGGELGNAPCHERGSGVKFILLRRIRFMGYGIVGTPSCFCGKGDVENGLSEGLTTR